MLRTTRPVVNEVSETAPPSSMGRRFKLSRLSAFLLCLPATAAYALDWGRPLDRGGDIGNRLRQIAAAPQRRHAINGDCMSSCTMWLGYKGTCVSPDAVLWFHAAADGLKQAHYDNPWLWKSAEGNRILLSFYPPRVRNVVTSNRWLETPEMHTLTGSQLIALGVPACG